MKIVYSAQALADLADIADYLNKRNPVAAEGVAGAVRRTIERLADHPNVGRLQDRPNVRKLVEPRYGHVIYYEVGEAAVSILTVQHPSRDRPFQDA